MPKFRTRYAPSPTGFLHLGNARTALFSYLLAKHYEGTFLIRIEDTDIERNVTEGVENQISNLQWLGIDYDEGPYKEVDKYAPYYQSQRLAIYNRYLQKLIKQKRVYKCFCSKNDLLEMKKEQEKQGKKAFMYDRRCLNLTTEEKQKLKEQNKPYVYRFYVEDDNNQIEWNDLVRGKVRFDVKNIEDFVIIKSNGFPVYNFANVVDDLLMEITHVVRGEEHISNTPKQLLLYQAFKKKPPLYGHLPVIVNKNKKKLSKRDAEVMQFISQYREAEILPQALFNYLAFLGWTPGEEREIYSKEELIKKFDFKRITKAPSQYNIQKLLWYNKEYLKLLTPEQLFSLRTKNFQGEKIFQKNNKKITLLHLISQILEINEWTFKEHKDLVNTVYKQVFNQLKTNKNIKEDFIKETLKEIKTIDVLTKKDNYFLFTKEILQLKEIILNKLLEIRKKLNIKPKDFFQGLRIHLTNQTKGPDLWRIIIIWRILWQLK